jgi:hypothetical protein
VDTSKAFAVPKNIANCQRISKRWIGQEKIGANSSDRDELPIFQASLRKRPFRVLSAKPIRAKVAIEPDLKTRP